MQLNVFDNLEVFKYKNKLNSDRGFIPNSWLTGQRSINHSQIIDV